MTMNKLYIESISIGKSFMYKILLVLSLPAVHHVAASQVCENSGFSSHVLAGAILGTFFLTLFACVILIAGLFLWKRRQLLAGINIPHAGLCNVDQGTILHRPVFFKMLFWIENYDY